MVQQLFWLFSGMAIVSAFLCVTRKSPVASALWLVWTMFSLAAIYVLLDAHFIAAIQVMVYAGAIMVLFLFVIMLLNLRESASGATDLKGWAGRATGGLIAFVLLVELWVVRTVMPDAGWRLPAGQMDRLTQEQGAVQLVAEPLFTRYLVPFEATALLLLAATVGAVVLAKRRL